MWMPSGWFTWNTFLMLFSKKTEIQNVVYSSYGLIQIFYCCLSQYFGLLLKSPEIYFRHAPDFSFFCCCFLFLLLFFKPGSYWFFFLICTWEHILWYSLKVPLFLKCIPLTYIFMENVRKIFFRIIYYLIYHLIYMYIVHVYRAFSMIICSSILLLV